MSQRLTKLTNSQTDTMQLLTNLFLLAHLVSLTSGLRVIANGIGLPVYGFEENVVDYALLALDKKAALPNQVQAMCCFLYVSFSVHHLLVCNIRCFADPPPLLPTSPAIGQFLGFTVYVGWWRQHSQIIGNVTPTGWFFNSPPNVAQNRGSWRHFCFWPYSSFLWLSHG